jgi:hypothetical protein
MRRIDVVEAAGGLKRYCGTTGGCIEFVDNTCGSSICDVTKN